MPARGLSASVKAHHGSLCVDESSTVYPAGISRENEISGVVDALGQARFRRRGNSVLGSS
jgi:hypothetical protein